VAYQSRSLIENIQSFLDQSHWAAHNQASCRCWCHLLPGGAPDRSLARVAPLEGDCHRGLFGALIRDALRNPVGFGRIRRTCTRGTRITAEPEILGLRPSTPSAPSASGPKLNGSNGLARGDPRTVATDADDRPSANLPGPAPTVRTNPLNGKDADGADRADANLPYPSTPEKGDGPGWSARL